MARKEDPLMAGTILWVGSPRQGIEPFHGKIVEVDMDNCWVRLEYRTLETTGTHNYLLRRTADLFKVSEVKRCTNHTPSSLENRFYLKPPYGNCEGFHFDLINPEEAHSLHPVYQTVSTPASININTNVPFNTTTQKENVMNPNQIYAHVIRTKQGWHGQVLMASAQGYNNADSDEIVWQSPEPVTEPVKDESGTVIRSEASIARAEAEEHIRGTIRWLFSEESPAGEETDQG